MFLNDQHVTEEIKENEKISEKQMTIQKLEQYYNLWDAEKAVQRKFITN